MKKLILNPEFGMAGDMLSAALLSAGVPEAQLVRVMKSAASLLDFCEITAKKEQRGEVTGIYLSISLDDHLHGIEVSRAHEHLKKTFLTNNIKGEYRDFAYKALTILGQAEQKAHIKKSMAVHHHTPHLHEAQDIIIDLAGAAFGLQELKISLSSVVCLSPVRVGGGRITFSHGTLDVPAPATAQIIEDYAIPFEKGPVDHELFTPTGAAILAALEPEYVQRDTYKQTLLSQETIKGTGFGSLRIKEGKQGPNALCIYLADSSL